MFSGFHNFFGEVGGFIVGPLKVIFLFSLAACKMFFSVFCFLQFYYDVPGGVCVCVCVCVWCMSEAGISFVARLDLV